MGFKPPYYLSAYGLAVKKGFKGTLDEWLASLKGEKGEPGEKGPQGEKGAQGAQGAPGEKGADGYTPVKGRDYFTVEDKVGIVNDVLDALPNLDEMSF